MKKKKLLLCLTASALLLAACGETPIESSSIPSMESSVIDESSSDTSSLSSVSTVPSEETIDFGTALRADYSNVTVAYYQEYSGIGETAYEYYVDDYLIVDDYTAAESGYTGYYRYSAYHQYEGDWYTYWPASMGYAYDGWLNKGYHDADLSPYNAYFTLSHLLEALHEDDVEFIMGAYYVKEDRAEDIINSAFEFYGDPFLSTSSLKGLAFLLDEEGRFSKIIGSVSATSDDGVVLEFGNYGSTVSPMDLPPAPNSSNIHTYAEMKGDEYVPDVYPTGISLALAEGASTTITIDDSIEVISTIAPYNANYYTISWASSDPDVAVVDYKDNWTKGHKYITGVGVGQATITASVTGEDGQTIRSNEIIVTVVDIPEQNKDGAVYDFVLTDVITVAKEDGTYDHSDVSFVNLVSGAAPFSVTGHNVSALEAKNTDSFGSDGLVLVSTPSNSAFMNNGFYSSIDFDFGSQEVNGLSFHYALHRASQKGDALSALSEAYISVSSDGVTYSEPIDMLTEMKEEFGKMNVDYATNLKLMERSFAPASKVRIYYKANIVGKNLSLCMDDFVFTADESCKDYDEEEVIEVTGVDLAVSSTSLKVGSSTQIDPSFTPSDATNKHLTYVSSNPDVASVSSSGLISACSEGTTVISATADNGVTSNQITITVYAQETLPESVMDTYVGLEVEANDGYYDVTLTFPTSSSASLTYTDGVTPVTHTFAYQGMVEDAYAPYHFVGDGVTLDIKFTSSGLEFFFAGSSTTFGNTYTNSGASLGKYVASTGISVKESSSSSSEVTFLTLTQGKTKNLVASVRPSSASYTAISAASENEAVATISRAEGSNYFTVNAVGVGSTNLVFTSKDGATVSIPVTVNAPVLLTSFTLVAGETSLAQGASTSLTPVFVPSNPDSVSLTYSSSDSSIATVSKDNGGNTATVTAVSSGSVTITAVDAVSGQSANIEITVTGETATIPSSLVGAWNGEDNVFGASTVVTISANGTLNLDVGEYDFHLVLSFVSSFGNKYTFSDGENTVEVEVGSSGIYVTLNDGEYTDDSLCYNGNGLFQK